MISLVAHSGGPTAVINASLLGVIEEARRHSAIGGLYGAWNGIEGILGGSFVDLFRQDPATLDAISRAPASALGSSRLEVSPEQLERALDVMRANEVRCLFYTGGNGSMGTAWQIENMARDLHYEIQVIGIPKTIDNDLFETDHTPGYASTARFFACAVRDIGADNLSLPGQVEFVEVMGRNAGWLVAATSLARSEPDDAPHLIYFPEVRLPLEKLMSDIDGVYRRLGRCVIAVCEGQLDETGERFGADVREVSRGSLALNLAHRLAVLVENGLRLRTRSEKPGLLGRSSVAFPCPADWEEARLCGQAAVRAALDGVSGEMITLLRNPGESYSVSTGRTAFDKVAFREKLFPAEWRDSAGTGVMPAFHDWAAPLIGPIAPYPRLKPMLFT
ncbi:MAG TPA: diphosphate--fructose-6-phosphate 1-phosphotransferase [Bryobacteraceae bacterium]|nr:diphosphate--fructose-6-phosphate 1-phosphotransferase [Bryobacteraceae bacterium]